MLVFPLQSPGENRHLIPSFAYSCSNDRLKIGFSKGMLDGSLGSHTAAFFEPYTDQPQDRGLYLLTKEELLNQAIGADAAGLQLAIHAIGDRAISDLLDVYEQVIKKNGARDRRLRIEHAQHPKPADFARFKKLKVILKIDPVLIKDVKILNT